MATLTARLSVECLEEAVRLPLALLRPRADLSEQGPVDDLLRRNQPDGRSGHAGLRARPKMYDAL